MWGTSLQGWSPTVYIEKGLAACVATKKPATANKLRDYVSMGLGSFLFLYQAITWHISAELLGAALVLVLGPGAIGLFQLARGSDETLDTPEPRQPSQRRSQPRR